MLPPKQPAHTAEDYWSLPNGSRAELIDGRLWNLSSPGRKHQYIVGRLHVALCSHIGFQGEACQVYAAPFAVNLFGDNSTFVEPDLLVICDRAKLSDRGCEGAPDFIVEVVSPNNPAMDYITKLGLYKKAGVREYWICDPGKERTFVYQLDADSAPVVYPFSAPVPSAVFPGFEVCIGEMIAEM